METKETFNLKRLLITTVIVLVAAGATAGTTYYVLNQNFQKERDANQKALDDVNAQLNKVTSPATTNQAVADSTTNLKTYSYSTVTFKYPGEMSLSDVTSTRVGTDINNFPWYQQTSFVKKELESGKTLIKILDSTDKDKVIGSFGGTGTIAETFKVGSNTAYYITHYGQSAEETDGSIAVVLVGSKYSVGLFSTNGSDSTSLKSIIKSVTFN